MANYLTDQGICLRVADYSETSQIATLLSRAHGVVPGIAKGSKRVAKNGPGAFSGPLDALTIGELVFIAPKPTSGSELATLTAWQVRDHLGALRHDLGALDGAWLAAEVTLALVHPYESHSGLFAELLATLDLLAGATASSAPVVPTFYAGGVRALVAYVKAVLIETGYQPHLQDCLVCHAPVTASHAVRFVPRAGGVICTACPLPTGHVAEGKPLPANFRRPASRGQSGQGGQDLPLAITLPGALAIALARLEAPTALRRALPERSADPAALRLALEILLDQVQAIADRALRTRWVLERIFRPSAGAS